MKLSYLIKKILFPLTYDGFARGKFLKKYGNLAGIGENIFFQPRKLPGEPNLLKFHNNIAIASGVVFVTHDVMHVVFNFLENNSTLVEYGPIEVGNNVFIGANAIILPNTKIGDNSIIAAGAVVTKNVPEGKIVGGNPARVIGHYDEIINTRKKKKKLLGNITRPDLAKIAWRDFSSNNSC